MGDAIDEFSSALDELNKNQETIQQIVSFCKTSYTPDKEAEVFKTSKEYTANVLLNVAYHVQNVATKLTSCIQLQTSELERLELQIKTLSDRVQSYHDFKGAADTKTQESARPYQRVPKLLKLDESQIPKHLAGGSAASSDSLPPPPPPPPPR